MPKADDIANRYSLATGQPLDNWNFYMALGYFKVAILAAGIAFRARRADSSADRDAGKYRRRLLPLSQRAFRRSDDDHAEEG
jgi:aminoglycoside phosphotransferase (APT) family kinase protein